MQRVPLPTLLAVIAVSSLGAPATAAKPYSNYGFYSPYPPPPDQAIYDFAPIQQVDGGSSGLDGGHRATRDSAIAAAAAWRDEFDAFLDGDREPTCGELREMWNYARNLQQRAARSRQGREPQPPLPPFLAFSPLEESKEGKGEGDRREASEARPEEGDSPPPPPSSPPRQANRRRMSTPPNTPGRGRPRPPGSPKAASTVRGEGEGVYGVVKTHAPPKTTMHVRDPAKAIYSLLKEKSLLGGSAAGGQRIFGKVRAHAQPESQGGRAPSYMDVLEKELYGARDSEGGSEDSYGSVKYEVSGEDDLPASSFERVRALVAAERAMNNGAAAGEGSSAFDLIRERLMKTPPPPPSSSSSASKLGSNKAFRRKSSRKNRQRNVSAT